MWRITLVATCVFWSVMCAEAYSKNMEKRSADSYSGSYSGSTSGDNVYTGPYANLAGANNPFPFYHVISGNIGYPVFRYQVYPTIDGSNRYTGRYSDSTDNNNNYNDINSDYYDNGYAPNFGFGYFNLYKFQRELTSKKLAESAARNHAIALASSNGDATVQAGAEHNFKDFNDLIKHQRPSTINSIINKIIEDNRQAPNLSLASAFVGPNGGSQTAVISPENPATPNIQNRFFSYSPSGYKGISVGSYSTSSDINGKKTSRRGAHTTINDNGKITTYKVES